MSPSEESPRRDGDRNPATGTPRKDTAVPINDGHDPWGDRLMRIFWRKPASSLAEQVRRRTCVHLIPILFCLYIVAYLDRANIGWAKLDMTKKVADGGLAFSNEIIGFGMGIFFWGYLILEIPSTLSVLKRGARWVFIRILVLWGICATLTGFIGHPLMETFFGLLPRIETELPVLRSIFHYTNELPTNAAFQLYFFRFLLGVFEGGFFPTVIYYLSVWFRQQDRAKAIALFMAAIPLSLAFGSVLSQQLFKITWFDLQGWRWIFIIQGLLPIVAAIATAFLLPDRTKDARWLSAAERTWLDHELEYEHAHRKLNHGFGGFKSQLGVVLLLTLVYFGQNVSSYGLSTFMPSFYAQFMKTPEDKELDDQLSALRASLAKKQTELEKTNAKETPEWNTAMKTYQAEIKPEEDRFVSEIDAASKPHKPYVFLLTTCTYLIAFAGMLFNGWHSDRHHERVWHVAFPLFCLGIMILLAGVFYQQSMVALVIMLVGVGFFHYAHLPAFWPIPTMFLGTAAAASAIGFINMIGNIGGFVGPMVVGKEGNTSFQTAMYYMAPAPILSALIILGISFFHRKPPNQS